MGSLPMMIMTYPHTAGWSEIGVPTFDIMCCCCSVFFFLFLFFHSLPVFGVCFYEIERWSSLSTLGNQCHRRQLTFSVSSSSSISCVKERNTEWTTLFFLWCVPGWLKGAPKAPYYIHTTYRVKDIGCLPGSKRFFLLLLMYFFPLFSFLLRQKYSLVEDVYGANPLTRNCSHGNL